MAGMTVRFFPYQQVTTQNNLPANTTAIVYSARRIDASRFKSAIITARLHAVTWTGGSAAQVVFEAGPDAYTDDDPTQIWTTPGAGNIVTFTQGTDTAPTVRTGSIDGTLGHLPALLIIRIKLIAVVGAAATITPTLSADLTLRES